MVVWLREIKWSKNGSGPFEDDAVIKSAYRCTWAEMMILFMKQTGFTLDRANLDFHNQERAFKVTVCKILQMTRIKYKSKKSSAKEL